MRHDALLDVLLAQAKVGQLDVALRVQQHVLRLQIPVDDTEVVQVLERQNDLAQVKAVKREEKYKIDFQKNLPKLSPCGVLQEDSFAL